MKSLSQYIFERLINENTFTTGYWEKYDFKYSKAVLKYILDNQDKPDAELKLDDGGSIKVSDFNIKKIQNIYNNIETSSENDFNNAYNIKTKKNIWRNLFKGDFSGHETKGGMDGQIYESLVCYIYNNNLKYDLETWKTTMKLSDTNDKWIKSSELLASFITKQKENGYKWTPNNYVACHVDGNNIGIDDYKDEIIISKIFASKKNATKIIGVDCNDLYNGNSKDVWNKADIVLIKKGEAKNIIQTLKAQVSDGQSLNGTLIQMLYDGLIIPLSLKAVGDADKIHLSTFNINKDKEASEYIISDVEISFADKYEPNKNTGNINIKCTLENGSKKWVVFKKKANGNDRTNLVTIETKSPGGKAQEGKATSTIMSALNIKDNNFIIPEESKIFNIDDVIEILKGYKFKVTKIDSVKNYIKSDDECPIYKRPCIAGLLGILDAYHKLKNKNITEDFPKEFANFCILSSIYGSGAYYKISE